MDNIADIAEVLKALADNTRLEIINLLSCGKMCVCDLVEELDLSQPNISHHLKILKNANLIIATKRGRWVDYQLNQEVVEQLQNNLKYITTYDAQKCDFERSTCE
ncbi:ArsR family transcriptional regulator [Orenia metallireducens]|uniref:Transcriptional regulator, ArsR family n=1 Tax=Orenia metallireducens TaxID=1413210 RepID=A0A285HH35_9FIRM|nr:metalloregulator ArsR/SmtB family transcription factor [Orenia metallireducens]PRX27166.1 ArsR family transcriptional regulator [Orenia metallireducens]SNY35069.1 transcriptional regulator, ArsR family [Orenia metallireducens]